MVQSNLCSNWLSGFWGEDFEKVKQNGQGQIPSDSKRSHDPSQIRSAKNYFFSKYMYHLTSGHCPIRAM